MPPLETEEEAAENVANIHERRDDTRKKEEPDFDKYGIHINGLNRNAYNINGLDKDGLDKDGYNINGLDKDGLNRNGLNINGIEGTKKNIQKEKLIIKKMMAFYMIGMDLIQLDLIKMVMT